MRAISARIFLALFILVSITPSLVIAATEKRTALVIGKDGYSSSPLKNALTDASDMAANLKKLGFPVTLMKNASHQEMEDAVREFGEQFKKNVTLNRNRSIGGHELGSFGMRAGIIE